MRRHRAQNDQAAEYWRLSATFERRSRRWLWIPCVAALITGHAPGQTSANQPARLPTLERLLKHFDFEDAERFNTVFPEYFYRYDASSQGFPPFGDMHLSDQTAASGRWSFQFDLAGGSMSARIPVGVLPVLPHADYLVSTRVKTAGLVNARARLVAWLHDKAGKAIDGSRTASRPVDTAGRWDALSVEVRGEYPDAADLVLELQVLQPRQFSASGGNADAPMIDDLSGHAWFDDVIVTHLPRLSITLNHGGKVLTHPAQPILNVSVSELGADPLIANLRVFDLDGQPVNQMTFPAPRGRHSTAVELPLHSCGWFRAVLDITAEDALVRRRWIDFVILPAADLPSATATDDNRFAVVLPQLSAAGMESIPSLVSHSGAGCAIVPAWDAAHALATARDRSAPRRSMIEQLILQRIDLIVSLDRVPDELARALNLETSQVLEMVRCDPKIWRPYLDELLVNFGLEISRWQIGPCGSLEATMCEQLPQCMDAAARSLGDFVPRPRVFVPWTAENTFLAAAPPHSHTISVPCAIGPPRIDEYAREWIENDDDVVAILEQLTPTEYSSRRRVTDLMLRALHAWRAGIHRMAIDAPWSYLDQRQTEAVPDPAMVVWRTLAQRLRGRRFACELPSGRGKHCWILQGQGSQPAALVAWSDGFRFDRPSILRSQFAAGPVTVIDAFGNRQDITPDSDGFHSIELDETPLFIEGINRALVQFRGGLAVEPGFLPAIAAVHEHLIVLPNPWNASVSGTIRVSSDAEWQLSPAVQSFSIPAGGEVRLPLNIIPERNILAGRKSLEAEVVLNADRAYTLKMQTEVEVGLKNIDLVSTWSVARNVQTGQDDLVINNVITNKGDHTINLDVFLLAEGVGQNRRTIAGLSPGATAVRAFRVANGAALLGGKQVRVGVSERDGVTRLNRVLSIAP